MFADFFSFSNSRSNRPAHFSRSRLRRALHLAVELPVTESSATTEQLDNSVYSAVDGVSFRRLDRHGRWKEMRRLVHG